MFGASRLGLYNAAAAPASLRTAKTVTLGTDHSYSTTTYKFGTASLQNDSGDYAVTFTQASSDFSIGANQDFTVEFWAYPTTLNADARPLLILMDDIGTTSPSGLAGGDFCLAVMLKSGVTNGGSYLTCYIPNGSGSVTGVNFGTFASTIATNSWQHIAISRASGVMRGFVNGSQGNANFPTSGTDNRTLLQTTGASPPRVWIGNSPSTGETNKFIGYIDDVRITRSALYTAPFTAPTAPLTNTADTVLLLHFDSNTDDDTTSS